MLKISDKFEFWPGRTTDYGVSCPWASKKFPIDLKWENAVHEFDCWPDQTTHFGVTCPWMTKILHFRTWISLRPVGQSWSNFMCSITGVGKGCIMFWGWLVQNTGVHGNRKPPLTYYGENGVSTFSWLLLIWSFLYLQVMRTCIKSWTSSNFGQVGPPTMELAALERLKHFP